MEASVVICTHTRDRWDEVGAAVDSVRAQTLPAAEILVVVDHNPELLRELAGRWAGDVRVRGNDGARGLSGARNTGFAAATGSIVAFLDDDAVAEPDWLRYLMAGYEDRAVIGVGGRTRPLWESGRRPAWFPEEFDWVVGCSYRGLPASGVPVRNLFGGNASFRRSAFLLAGGFDTGIGRGTGTRPMGCEETEFCIRLTMCFEQSRLLLEERAVVWHRVPAARERMSYLVERCWAEGQSKALIARTVGMRRALAVERRYATRIVPAGVLLALRDAVRGRPGGALRAAAMIGGVVAAAAGYARASIRRPWPQALPAQPPAGAEP